jgi:hypothetical protein
MKHLFESACLGHGSPEDWNKMNLAQLMTIKMAQTLVRKRVHETL